MITASQISGLRGKGSDILETERLKTTLAKLYRERQPFYLTAVEFEEVLEWKLGQQIGRQRERRTANTDEIIRAITGLALTITHPTNKEYELELRINILCSLRGVGMGVASALLALAFPTTYAVIDYRGWRQCFGEEKTIFSVADYHKYLNVVRTLANELGWPVQEVDYAIWAYDKGIN